MQLESTNNTYRRLHGGIRTAALQPGVNSCCCALPVFCSTVLLIAEGACVFLFIRLIDGQPYYSLVPEGVPCYAWSVITARRDCLLG